LVRLSRRITLNLKKLGARVSPCLMVPICMT